MRHFYQNFDINCSIFSRSVSGKKSGLNAALESRIKVQCIRGQGITKNKKTKNMSDSNFNLNSVKILLILIPLSCIRTQVITFDNLTLLNINCYKSVIVAQPELEQKI
ncbi:hypothetical protein BpHYR1_003741 [Brachionus plicatilis]|uniref:Uncharacterized protein n=1 Tax=Brachionus plicatilis TaxID=10195 RepID=A0A3M7QT70_BRAPC|nr:hypothetical protein BpHYR1_003741 [Brachionus plicatilis]